MEAVRLERRGPVALLTLDRPERHNAFDVAMAAQLHDRVRAASKDPRVGAVVLTGAGDRAFCAGGDVAVMREQAEKDAPALFSELTRHLHPTVRLLVTMDKPTVAAVNGAVAGGGYGLALGCDLRIASDRARFKAAYLSLGVVPDGGITFLLPRIVGPAKARELLMLDAPVDADEALRLGLVSRVVAPERLLEEAVAVADRLARAPRHALGRTKKLFAQSQLATLEEQLRAERRWNAESAAHPDFLEGLRAFAEKRPARFPSAEAASDDAAAP